MVVVPELVEFEEVLEVEAKTFLPPAHAQQKLWALKSASLYLPSQAVVA
jgi:hypothetical protein